MRLANNTLSRREFMGVGETGFNRFIPAFATRSQIEKPLGPSKGHHSGDFRNPWLNRPRQTKFKTYPFLFVIAPGPGAFAPPFWAIVFSNMSSTLDWRQRFS
jgi:hypothetical protein